jgi:The GLUG motif
MLAGSLVACGRLDFEAVHECGARQVAGVPYANSSDGATGASEGTAFLICTADQLARIGEHREHWASWFRLGRDLDLAGRSAPVPMIGDAANAFTGRFDGAGHAISQLRYDLPTTDAVGLFSTVAPGARFSRLSLREVDVRGQQFVGALVGYGQGPVIEDVFVEGRVVGARDVGGVVGGAECYQQAKFPACDGIVFAGVRADIAVTASQRTAGGILGYTYSDSSVVAALSSLESSGTVSGGSTIGGLIGDAEAVELSSSRSSAAILATSLGGGLVGNSVYSFTRFTTSSASGSVTCTGAGSCGGLIGGLEGSVDNSFATGRVMCDRFCGGLVGWTGGPVVESYATGDVIGGTSSIGGLVGLAYGTLVRDCYATGAVSGQAEVGGLIGARDGGTTTSSYSTSTVTGIEDVGGVIGHLTVLTSPTAVIDTFATGRIMGASTAGRVSNVVGGIDGTVAQSGNAFSASCTNTAGACTNVATDVGDPSYFFTTTNDPLSRWDFSTIWQPMPASYPQLQ